jgi:hypothetical protein
MTMQYSTSTCILLSGYVAMVPQYVFLAYNTTKDFAIILDARFGKK